MDGDANLATRGLKRHPIQLTLDLDILLDVLATLAIE
jgi:hypothetical protein